MYEFTGFTQSANNALNYSIEAAENFGHTYIGSEHLLLGLLSDSRMVSASILGSKKVTLKKAEEHDEVQPKTQATQLKGIFDDEDLFIHLHTMGESTYHFSLNSSLAGFVYKEITFKGKATHAAVAPHNGINALNAFVLFDNAVNMLRETFKEEDHIRIHGILNTGGQTVNSIPEKTVYECYVRSLDQEALLATAKR